MRTKPENPFEPFDRMIRIKVLGHDLEVPDNNTMLRGLSYLYPDDIAGGKFCWNAECNNSKFYFRLPGETVDRKARMCRFVPREGMEITVLSAELKYVLRKVLSEPGEEPATPLPAAAET